MAPEVEQYRYAVSVFGPDRGEVWTGLTREDLRRVMMTCEERRWEYMIHAVHGLWPPR